MRPMVGVGACQIGQRRILCFHVDGVKEIVVFDDSFCPRKLSLFFALARSTWYGVGGCQGVGGSATSAERIL